MGILKKISLDFSKFLFDSTEFLLDYEGLFLSIPKKIQVKFYQIETLNEISVGKFEWAKLLYTLMTFELNPLIFFECKNSESYVSNSNFRQKRKPLQAMCFDMELCLTNFGQQESIKMTFFLQINVTYL